MVAPHRVSITIYGCDIMRFLQGSSWCRIYRKEKKSEREEDSIRWCTHGECAMQLAIAQKSATPKNDLGFSSFLPYTYTESAMNELVTSTRSQVSLLFTRHEHFIAPKNKAKLPIILYYTGCALSIELLIGEITEELHGYNQILIN